MNGNKDFPKNLVALLENLKFFSFFSFLSINQKRDQSQPSNRPTVIGRSFGL